MKEYFEKVEIKSEADLPKEDGMYFVNIKGKGIGLNVCRFADKEDVNVWLDVIDWYLRPVTDKAELREERIWQKCPVCLGAGILDQHGKCPANVCTTKDLEDSERKL